MMTARFSPGCIFFSSARAPSTSFGVQISSKPAGVESPASRKTFRPPDFVPRCVSDGSQPKSGMPRRTARRRSSGVELKTVRNARDGSWIPARIRSISRGRSRIFSVSERAEES